jgi:glycosyltransferase involved in cell wall biosynthesis
MSFRQISPKSIIRAARGRLEARQLDDQLSQREGLSWRRSAPCDIGLYDAGAAQIGQLLYVFGGYSSLASVSDSIRLFNMETETWQRSVPAPSRLAQSHCAVATDSRRFVFCASGQLGPQCSPAIPDVFSFDTFSGVWTNLPPLPSARYAGTMQLWRGRLHFIGGALEDRWTPSSDHWSLGVKDGVATEDVWRAERPIPVPGMHRGSVIHQDALYVLGGQQGDFVAIKGDPNCKCTGHTQETYLAECFRLDEPGAQWTRLADLPIPASHTDFSIVDVGDQLLLIGGQIYKDPTSFYLRLTDAIQSYDPRRNAWSVAGHLPYRLKIPLVGRWKDKLYLIGGQRGQGLDDFPGPVSRDVWAAQVSGLNPRPSTAKLSYFSGKSILLLTHALSYSGAPLLLAETAERLIDAGASVRLASLGNDTAGWTIAARKGIPVIPIEKAADYAAESDLVIANTVTKEVMAWVTNALQRYPDLSKRLICWVHEIDVEHFLPGAATISRAAMTIFDSKACMDAWTAELGALPKATVIHPSVNADIAKALLEDRMPMSRNPLSQSAFRDGLLTRDETRSALGVGPADFLILSLATVEERKGQKLLLQTVAKIAAEQKLPLKLLLVGFRNWRQRLKFLLRMRAGERAVLSRRRAYLWQTEIAAFYRAADAFVTNTQGLGALRGECFGRATVEAMAAGTVVLGTAVGGTAEIIVNGESGFLYPPGREGQSILKDQLAKLVGNPDFASSISSAGTARATVAFSEKRFFAEFEEQVRASLDGH